ncbi:MAG: hypothetical protein EOP83_00260 [Verrucomicrobiaceae bacterium]|nr:MAG: hypothetical protein EOP83_00260 [Verrucomicrobiaceae bacterium]
MRGGTYVLGGTPEASLNITYNYAKIFHACLGEDGIRSIYGKTADESIAMLREGMSKLNHTDVHPDYWQACEGNVAAAMQGLIDIALMVKEVDPTAVWAGD